ncbi:MAG: addiction module protein [Campylobacterota bacterium]|nr:addiction module protein [Campylobacterota bacterium]
MSTNEILTSALELPIDERVIITDMLTQSLNPLNGDIEKNWIEETKRRMELLDNNNLETISYEEFFIEN